MALPCERAPPPWVRALLTVNSPVPIICPALGALLSSPALAPGCVRLPTALQDQLLQVRRKILKAVGLSCPQPDADHPARWVCFLAPRPSGCEVADCTPSAPSAGQEPSSHPPLGCLFSLTAGEVAQAHRTQHTAAQSTTLNTKREQASEDGAFIVDNK